MIARDAAVMNILWLQQTLFRWGRKYLHYFTADLFGILCARFYQNWPSFTEEMGHGSVLQT